MPFNAIISYDGTTNDDDAIALGSVLNGVGAKPILAYVHHDAGRGAHSPIEDPDAQARLDRGTEHFGATTETRIVHNASTSDGLKELAATEDAELVVFGSAYRTPIGRVVPQQTTEIMLDNGPVAVAIAPAGYRARPIRTIGLLASLDNSAAIDTAHSLARAFGANVVDDLVNVDLLVVGSRPETEASKVLLSARAENAIIDTTAPVLVVRRGVALSFTQPAFAA